jgi:hypothetical protein
MVGVGARNSASRESARAAVPARAVQFPQCVSSGIPRVRILFIRPWTASLSPVREALRDAGIAAMITRVDIEPALNAALGRGGRFDVVIHDASTPGIPREVLDARLREHRRAIPVVPLQALDDLVAAVRVVLRSQLN